MTTVTQNTRNDADAVAPTLMLIGGDARESADGTFIDVENPANRTIVGRVPRAGGRRRRRRGSRGGRRIRAVASASLREIAAGCSSRLPTRSRRDLESLARILALETGNAIRTQARPEVKGAADVFRYFGGLASELKGETIPLGEHVLSYTRREPIGVVGAIVPWNAPVVLGALKIAMAVAAGNTLVLKAAEDAPLALLRVAQICGRHLPPGVLNLITGYGEECGAALARHPLVRKLSFTGSTEVGKIIMHAAADRIVPVSLELGGKSPAMVFPDADDDRTVDGVIAGMRVTRQGQSCTAGSRLFLHRSIFESFLDEARRTSWPPSRSAIRSTRPPTWAPSSTGSSSTASAATSTTGCGSRALVCVLGGLPPQDGPLAQGYFVQPTVFADVRNDWRIAREEIFGPVMVAIPWEDEADAIRMANDSHYGLAAYVWTRDHRQGDSHRARDRIRLGSDQPGTRPVSGTVLRRLQAERHRPRVLARGDARQLHPAEERHRQPRAVNLANAGSPRHPDVRSAAGCGCTGSGSRRDSSTRLRTRLTL